METQEIHLKLTVADLAPSYRDKPPPAPRFFHFLKSAKEFHEATLITFTYPNGTEVVIKDTFGRRVK